MESTETKTTGSPRTKLAKGDIPPYAKKLPSHVTNIIRIIKNNCEIRRFTSLGIINYLKQKDVITGDKNYVTFKWDKFIVSSNGWNKEYRYNETFFITCLIASFSCFANSAQKTIDEFIDNIKLDKSVYNSETIMKIVEDVESDKSTLPVEGEQPSSSNSDSETSNSDTNE